MNAIVPFNYGDHPLRIENRDGEPWFVLADVCRALDIANVSDAAKRLDDDERDDIALTDAIGRQQQTAAINEAGLYRLALRSRKESAKAFTRWLTHEVLPSIRRTGSYGASAPALDLNDTATLQRLLLDHTGRTLASEERLAELEPKAKALDQLTDAVGSLAPTYAAKLMGVAPGKLFDWLEAHCWLYRGADGLQGYADKLRAGLIEHKAHRLARAKPPRFVSQALITPKGIAKLTELGAGR